MTLRSKNMIELAAAHLAEACRPHPRLFMDEWRRAENARVRGRATEPEETVSRTAFRVCYPQAAELIWSRATRPTCDRDDAEPGPQMRVIRCPGDHGTHAKVIVAARRRFVDNAALAYLLLKPLELDIGAAPLTARSPRHGTYRKPKQRR